MISAVSATANGAKQQINEYELKIELLSNLKLCFQKLQLSRLSEDYVLIMLEGAPFEEGAINLNFQ